MPPDVQRGIYLNELSDLAAKGDGVVRVGFSGTRYLNSESEDALSNIVSGFAGYFVGACGLDLEITQGGCEGADTFVAWHAHNLGMPRVTVHTVLPPDHKLVAKDWREWSTTWEQDDHGYRSRNKKIVRRVMALMALPAYPEHHPKSRRSGTWMCIRIALEAVKPVCVRVQHEEEG